MDQIIWSSFIYSLFCARPFNLELALSLIYISHLYTTILQKYMIFFHLFFLCAQPFDQKLGFSLIYFFYLYTTIQQKYIIVFHLFFLFARPFDQKLGSSLIYLFLFVHDNSTKVRGHSYSLVYSFLNCVNISLAIFMAILPLQFVRPISGSTAFIFCLVAVFIAVLPFYFVHYIHGSAALIFPTLYSWLYEVLAKLINFICLGVHSQKHS